MNSTKDVQFVIGHMIYKRLYLNTYNMHQAMSFISIISVPCKLSLAQTSFTQTVSSAPV
jgi:hypothetical protein